MDRVLASRLGGRGFRAQSQGVGARVLFLGTCRQGLEMEMEMEQMTTGVDDPVDSVDDPDVKGTKAKEPRVRDTKVVVTKCFIKTGHNYLLKEGHVVIAPRKNGTRVVAVVVVDIDGSLRLLTAVRKENDVWVLSKRIWIEDLKKKFPGLSVNEVEALCSISNTFTEPTLYGMAKDIQKRKRDQEDGSGVEVRKEFRLFNRVIPIKKETMVVIPPKCDLSWCEEPKFSGACRPHHDEFRASQLRYHHWIERKEKEHSAQVAALQV